MKVRQISLRSRRLVLAGAVAAAATTSLVLVRAAGAQTEEPRQGPPSGEQTDPRQIIDRRLAFLTEKLGLDTTQQAKVRSVLADETMQMEALRPGSGGQRGGERGGGGGGRGGRRRNGGGGAPPDSAGGGQTRGGFGSPEARAIQEKADQQIEAVLTPQQRATYELIRHQQQQGRANRDTTSRR
ncbi:MAG TPA: hypothetical protein VGG76_03990 [Gemmatimonadaceae bacterium]